MTFNNGTYTAIQDWMLDLGLDVWETIAYAVIFGFSQDGESTFTGSLSYLSRKMMCSRAKTISALKRLVELGLVQKIDITRNGVHFCEYRAYFRETGSISERPGVSPKDRGGISGIPGGGISERPNNIVIENIEENKERIDIKRFVPPSIDEISKYCQMRGNTIDPQEFFDHYTANGWKVGNVRMRDWRAAVRTWEARRKQETPNPRPFPRQQQESVYQRNARAFAEFQNRLNIQYADEQ